MWFESWSEIGRVAAVGATAYVFLVIALRVSGKRTLSQLNAFDFILTVALGSTLATIFLSGTVSWLQGATALVVLIVLQYVVARVSSRWNRFRKIITAGPSLLLRDGVLDTGALRRNRLADSEVRQAVRSHGHGDFASVAAVVLETNGTLSVIGASDIGSASALDDITGWN